LHGSSNKEGEGERGVVSLERRGFEGDHRNEICQSCQYESFFLSVLLYTQKGEGKGGRKGEAVTVTHPLDLKTDRSEVGKEERRDP